MNGFLSEILVTNWFQTATTIGLIVAWVVDRKKRKAETSIAGTTALDNIDDLYNKFSDRYKKEYDILLSRVTSLESQLIVANRDRADLIMRIEQFERQSVTDKNLISELTTKVDKQQVTIDNQKRQITQLEKTRK